MLKITNIDGLIYAYPFLCQLLDAAPYLIHYNDLNPYPYNYKSHLSEQTSNQLERYRQAYDVSLVRNNNDTCRSAETCSNKME